MYWYIYLLSGIGGFLLLLILIAIVVKIYVTLTIGKCKSNARLFGKTTIITGSNTGIGYETALDFARRGAKVILACRDEKTGKAAEERIIKKTANRNVFFKHLDLSSCRSIRQFTDEIIKSESRLDILVNNAGALLLPPNQTEDGFLLIMQTNYLGPFLLTQLLLDLMKKTLNSRIVNVSSIGAKLAKSFDVQDISTANSYIKTKLCNILFTIELAERLKGTSVTTYSLHPGVVKTEITRNYSMCIQHLGEILFRIFMKTAREGAQTTIYCSVTENIESLSGRHFHDCHVVKTYRAARNPELPKQLWEMTENLLHLNNI